MSYRDKKRKSGFKPVSFMLHETVIETIKKLQVSIGGSQAVVVAKAIGALEKSLKETPESHETSSSGSSEIHETSSAGSSDLHEDSSKKHEIPTPAHVELIETLQREVSFKNKELESKDMQLNQMIQAQLQSNALVANFTKKEDTLIEYNQVDDEPKKKKSKGKKKKKNKKFA